MNDGTDFADLVALLQRPLDSNSRNTESLRTDMAAVESEGIYLAQYRRTLEAEYDTKRAAEMLELINNPPERVKLTVDVQKALLDAKLADIKAKVEYVKELQELVKRRILMGQTFLNSMNSERQASNFN